MDSIADYLRDHRFRAMFTDLLGWEHAGGSISVSVAGRQFHFDSVAHKRGLQVLCCTTDRVALASRGLLRKVQREIARTVHEHILVFFCEQPRKQVWQWAVRLPEGRRVRHREHPFFSESPPAALLQRLEGLRFTLDEEEGASLIEALTRVQGALDQTAELNLFARFPGYAARSDALARAMQSGKTADVHRFLLFHRPLARKIAELRLCRWFGIPLEDAEQIVFFGLIEAARRFRPELGYQFSTYANHWIKNACQRHGPVFAYAIHIPPKVLGECIRLKLMLSRMLSAVGSGGVYDFLTELDSRDPKLGRQMRAFQRATELRSLSDRKEPEFWSARQIAEKWPSVTEELIQAEEAQIVNTAVDCLHIRQGHFVRLRYGLDGSPPQTLEQIGRLCGISKERVRQILDKAKDRLREMLGERLNDKPLPDFSELPFPANPHCKGSVDERSQLPCEETAPSETLVPASAISSQMPDSQKAEDSLADVAEWLIGRLQMPGRKMITLDHS